MLKISSVNDLQVGDVGFSIIPGGVGGFVSLGQGLIDVANIVRGRAVEGAWFTHTYIVVAAPGDGTAQIVEAMPSGARAVWMETGAARIGPGYGWARLELSDLQRALIAQDATFRVGTPYSFLDYLSIAALHLGLPRRWLAGRVTSSAHLICSQLVDTAYLMAGVHLFDDGRLPQDVTPGALFQRLGASGEVVWW